MDKGDNEHGTDNKFSAEGQKYYGEKIGGWASVKPDSVFIKGLLYHPYNELYEYKERFIKALYEAEEEQGVGKIG